LSSSAPIASDCCDNGKKRQPRAEPLQDERHDRQAQRLFAEQAAEDEVGDQAEEEGETQAGPCPFFEHPVGDREAEPVRPQRHDRRGQRQQAEQQRDDDADGQDPGGAFRGSWRAPRGGGGGGTVFVAGVAARVVCAAAGTFAEAGAGRRSGVGQRGRGRGRGADHRPLRRAAHEQDIAAAIELRGRLHVADEERARVVGPQRRDRSDRESGGKALARARK
jgi:hypothetical protein